MPPGGGRQYFNNQVRRSLAAMFIYLGFIEDYGNIRLYNRIYVLRAVPVAFKQPYTKGSGKDLACFVFEIPIKL